MSQKDPSTQPENQKRQAGEPQPALWAEEFQASRHSILSVEPAHRVECNRCQQEFLAAGPTGFRDRRPLCDLCILRAEPRLGMVLALVAVTRSYGSASPASLQEEVSDKSELMSFARIFESFSSAFAPARPVTPDALWPLSVPLDWEKS